MKALKIATAILGIVGVLLGALIAFAWHTGDAIDRAGIRTSWILWSHTVIDRSSTVREWLLAYHGEAPGSQVMNTFVLWAVNNKQGAEQLVAGLSDRQQQDIAARIGWAALDSGQDKEFVAAFAGTQSRCFQRALEELKRMKSMSSNE
jgi:hypothetical protein